MLLAQADPTLDTLTAWLVGVTGILALGTLVLAFGQPWGVRLQRRELAAVEDQLELNRQQIAVTREQLRPHLELQDPRWPQPGQLPTAKVAYVSGSEAAFDVCTWMRTGDGRRFAKIADTLSLSRPSHEVTIEELHDHLASTWDSNFAKAEEGLSLSDDEWWAAVTWQAADKARYCWMYVQRAHYVEHKEFTLPVGQQ
jgi:hypothetical protein